MFELLRAVQTDSRIPAEEIDALIRDAEARGWPEVVRAGLYVAVIHARVDGAWMAGQQLAALLERARADGDTVMTALAMAMRAQALPTPGDSSAAADTDRDLARATIMLEAGHPPSLELAAAHLQCALGYANRDLWELQLDHYELAEAALQGQASGERTLSVLLYNRAEVQLNWAAALLEVGETQALGHRAALARAALIATDIPGMPGPWREELQIFGELLEAISPAALDPAPLDHAAEGPYCGYVHLARALVAEPGMQARVDAERAVAEIDADISPTVRSLALCVSAEIEAALAGRETAGLRYARHLAHTRWNRRLSALTSMQSLLHNERLRAEHDLLSQHAYLDDLTGLGNRRALLRFVDGLVSRDVPEVALALIDLDDFKLVNDHHGHAVGDETLVALAGILRSAVREHDLAVRLGGDEFLVALALHDREAAERRCAAIVRSIATADWDQLAPGMRVTASAGVACGPPQCFDELRAAADVALYRSKAAGGNRACG